MVALYLKVFLDTTNIQTEMELLSTSFLLMHLSKVNGYEELTEKTYTQTKNSSVCSKHFIESDFIEERRGSNAIPAKKKGACLNINISKRMLFLPSFHLKRRSFFRGELQKRVTVAVLKEISTNKIVT